jgi:SAM-dependent methyltransferase
VNDDAYAIAVDAVAARYAPAGKFERGLAGGKLRFDPAYRALLDRGVAEADAITDLGCGRGYLPALILETRADPKPAVLHGIEVGKRRAALARLACGPALTVHERDLADADVPRANVITIVDVLHYMPRAAQDALLARCARALAPRGRLFIRDADAAAGVGFWAVRIAERAASLSRGDGFRAFAYRRSDELARTLEGLGLSIVTEAMGRGTPFANVLLEARAPA